MAGYWAEFLLLATAHLLAVASPGPDFAVVVRQSVAHGRRIAIWTSLGIAAGILLHVAYSLLGIGLIISQSVALFNLLKWIAAGYLLYLGWMALRTQPSAPSKEDAVTVTEPSASKSFGVGFLTNALNPKATLFFLSLFAVAISPSTPLAIKLIYGVYFAVATGAWFVGLSMLLGSDQVRIWLRRSGHWVERGMGVLLIGLAARLAFSAR